MANNIQIAQATTLRIKAHSLLVGINIPLELKKALKTAIDDVDLPLHRYFDKSNDEIKRAFISKVLGELGNKLDTNKREKLQQWLIRKM